MQTTPMLNTVLRQEVRYADSGGLGVETQISSCMLTHGSADASGDSAGCGGRRAPWGSDDDEFQRRIEGVDPIHQWGEPKKFYAVRRGR
jgi:hypothetical protein